MARRGKVIRGRFGSQRSRASGLPRELTNLLDVERKSRAWRRYLPLWGGAVAVGLIVGAGPSLLADKVKVADAAAPIATVQAAPQEQLNAPSRSVTTRAAPSTWFARPASGRTAFGFCHTGGGMNCVVDGDTIWIDGQNVRVADIDAPETHDYRCAEEKELGDKATRRLIQLVNGGSVTLQSIDRDEDRYGRKLRIVLVDGTSVGDTLVSQGLARYYEGGKRPWC